MGFYLRPLINLENSGFFDKEFSTFSTFKNVDNLIIPAFTSSAKWGILEFTEACQNIVKEIKMSFSGLFAN